MPIHLFLVRKLEVQLFGGTIFPSSVSPLHPHSVTPSGRPLAGENEFAFGKLCIWRSPCIIWQIIHTFLKFSRLKFDNSAKASNNQIFMRRFHLQKTRQISEEKNFIQVLTNVLLIPDFKCTQEVSPLRSKRVMLIPIYLSWY